MIEGLLWLRDADHWHFRGINVTWSEENENTQHMVKFTNGTGWSFEDAEVWDARSFAAILVVGTERGQPSDWRVAGNCVHDTHRSNGKNEDHLLYLNTGLEAGPGVVENNVLFGAENGTGVKLGGSSRRNGGAASVTVRNNTIHDAAQGVMVAWGSHSNRLERNLLTKAGRNYGLIRAYQLEGTNNVVTANAGGAADRLVLEDRGFERLVVEDDNRFPVDPRFDDTKSCDGFRPQGPARAYGRTD